ncbi:unnamed protein product [Phytomonas sp. EM1]|nr:unnamed protein product [Phytomonas sp. EM1]|eukprot:CCW65380.1 unnamed protein product [Phytomonas sp. isolate EM1]
MSVSNGGGDHTSNLLAVKPSTPLLTKRPVLRPYRLSAISTGSSSLRTPLRVAVRDHAAPRTTKKKNDSAVTRYESACISGGDSSCLASDGPSGGAPLLSPARPQSSFESLLQYLIDVDEQLLDDNVVRIVKTALTRLKGPQRPLPGPRPLTHSWLSSQSPLEEAVVECLCKACQAATDDAAVNVLSSFYLKHSTGSSGSGDPAACSPPMCPVVAALAQLRLQKVLCDPRRDAGDAMDDCLRQLDAVVGFGHPGAMVSIALCLKNGLGVPSDLEATLMWLCKAAQLGYIPAMHELGILYEQGAIVGPAVLEEDWGEAMGWYRRAAAAGHVPSQLNLGKLILSAAQKQEATSIVSALEIQHMTSKSREWLGRAARSGCEEAIRLLERI